MLLLSLVLLLAVCCIFAIRSASDSKLESEQIGDSYCVKGRDTLVHSVKIPKKYKGLSVTSIRAHAFVGCTDLENVTIPSSVTSIGDYAFSGCSSLKGITFQGTIAE
ncbi:MAG: leucine-rich repeat protein [Clostridia bacterium]|nr:leucine-rich repeat protein [Clostridia bacterium]